MVARTKKSTYDTAREALSVRLRTHRMALGLSQEALALEAGVDRTFVSQIERGVGNPSLRIMCLLADTLKLPLTSIFQES
jgi:transcriptional regulator with XRE-family HTH domain